MSDTRGWSWIFRMSIPSRPGPATPAAVTDSTTSSLLGQRILLVEDERIVAFLLEEMLGELGCVIAGTAFSVEDGLRRAEKIEANVALLDVNIDGEDVFPIAERLTKRGIPIVFATGYGDDGLPDAWQGHIVISKPFLIDDLAAALNAALGPGRR